MRACGIECDKEQELRKDSPNVLDAKIPMLSSCFKSSTLVKPVDARMMMRPVQRKGVNGMIGGRGKGQAGTGEERLALRCLKCLTMPSVPLTDSSQGANSAIQECVLLEAGKAPE